MMGSGSELAIHQLYRDQEAYFQQNGSLHFLTVKFLVRRGNMEFVWFSLDFTSLDFCSIT